VGLLEKGLRLVHHGCGFEILKTFKVLIGSVPPVTLSSLQRRPGSFTPEILKVFSSPAACGRCTGVTLAAAERTVRRFPRRAWERDFPLFPRFNTPIWPQPCNPSVQWDCFRRPKS